MEESPREFNNSQPEVNNQSEPSYWSSVATAGLIFGIIAFVLSLLSSYSIINSEPAGMSTLLFQSVIWLCSCLMGAFGGVLAIWLYEREYSISITLGKGALIGFLTGLTMAVISVLLNHIWQLMVDPDMMQNLMDAMIANVEAMDLQESQKQQVIDAMAPGARDQPSIFSRLLSSVPLYGILNLITGMIGAKVFGKKETEF